jgi:cell division protein FtsI/penicillin-binding protein 2
MTAVPANREDSRPVRRSRRPGPGVPVAAALLAGALALSGCTSIGGGGNPPSPGTTSAVPDRTAAAVDVATRYLRAWSADEDSGAAALTSDPAAAARLLSTTRSQLVLSKVTAVPGPPRPAADGAVDVPATVTLGLTGLGDARWQIVVHVVDASRATSSATSGAGTAGATGTAGGTGSPAPSPAGPASAAAGTGGPVVQYSPTLVHPDLTAATRLRRSRSLPVRASILDRDGKPLTVAQPLFEIGIQRSRLRDPAAAYRLLGSLPGRPDIASLQRRVAAAGPDQFVSVTTLRQAPYQPFAARLDATAGIRVQQRTTTLATSPTFARTVLGRLAPATSLNEQALVAAGPLVSTTDDVGTSGLQRAAQQQLAGTPGGALQIVPRTGGDPLATVQQFPGRPGIPLRTTLSTSAQQAAEAALATAPQAGALVAVQASTGQLLAVADDGVAADRQDGINRALNGRYPPGSTFKVVSAAALLAGGLSPSATVACPPAVTVDGRRFTNVAGESASGAVPFTTDFAQSCNTAFIGLRDRVPAAALTDTAKRFGLGLDWTLGVTSYGGSVPTPATETERGAAMIGQGRVLASPLAMAVVAATVASGRGRTPTLVTGTGQPPVSAQPPAADARVIGQLRTLMAQTVARGTATGLRGSATGAKTGTAEFGGTPAAGGQLPTHSWMVAYRGDLAVAVLIENGSTGARTAGPVMKRFLDAVR